MPRSSRSLVLIHGLLGCELLDPLDGARLYFGDDPAVFLPSILSNPARMRLEGGMPPLVPGGLTRNYRAFMNELTVRYVPGKARSLVAYAYDWRAGVAQAASGLEDFLANITGKITLITHSLGGLLALYAVASHKLSARTRARIERIILIASPFYGSSLALLALSGSPDFVKMIRGFLPIRAAKFLSIFADRAASRITELIAPTVVTFQSAYDLLPLTTKASTN